MGPAAMRIIRSADCRRMPWKNGGGETVEIATYPEAAGLDAFVWRLSAARVGQDGPFSIFPGVDRTLAVLAGEGMRLRVADATASLRPDDPPLSFPGDQPTEAWLLGGPVEDLNIMTRRGVARHSMRRLAVRGPARLAVDGTVMLLFCAAGPVTVGGETLEARDTTVLAEVGHDVTVDGLGTLYVIAIETLRGR